jgi:hypothetical protein
MFTTVSGFSGYSPSAGTPAASPDGSMEVRRPNEQALRRHLTHGKQRQHLIPSLLPSRSAGRHHIRRRGRSAAPGVPDGDSMVGVGPTPTSPWQDESVRATWVNRPGPHTGDPPGAVNFSV